MANAYIFRSKEERDFKSITVIIFSYFYTYIHV